MNAEKLKPLARDLRKTPPRSPRETLGFRGPVPVIP